MTEPILQIDGLVVRYGRATAVRDVDIAIQPGEIVGLVGPNGAGKSTTLMAVMGAVPAAAGRIRFDGTDITGARTERIVRRGIALVPEGRHVFPGLTVAENLQLGLVGRGRREGVQEDLERIHGLFPIVHEFRSRHAGLLSGGQQQQLVIARALLADPRLLLLDEPSLGLAPTVVETVWDAVRAIRDAGVTIMLVEQRAQKTTELADRSYILNNGEVRLEVGKGEAADPDRLVAAYFGS
jgi:branched-chain amino acid transport system ATP-binding protein